MAYRRRASRSHRRRRRLRRAAVGCLSPSGRGEVSSRHLPPPSETPVMVNAYQVLLLLSQCFTTNGAPASTAVPPRQLDCRPLVRLSAHAREACVTGGRAKVWKNTIGPAGFQTCLELLLDGLHWGHFG
ncbi:unnamed protein product, partial [Prorocentrum cordatum]